MRVIERGILGCILLIGCGFGAAAFACTTDGWLGGTGGIPPNAVAGSPPDVSRYSQLCALAVTEQAHVQSNFASDTRYRARFYVLNDLSGVGEVDIFEAYSDDAATSPLFKVSLDGSTFVFNATDAGGTTGEAAASSGWNLIEFDWDSDSSTFSYWVNADASVDPETGIEDAGSGSVEAVRLGAPNGFAPQTGKLTFDAFESRRTTAAGPLVACDAQGDTDIDINDALAVVDEVFGVPAVLASGQPDCDSNGDININDVLAIVDIVF